eukprot:TRINITY_DN44087_c0_g1_i1.p2 TRINITY_DN44087_c0_g1~~TRINITY_DN44087_c0_g1_i1.p2  ORF type:complete len:105 (+),score=21.92 TRINITY_DN44087_c0_g1_i1:35-349(+)
MMFLFCLLIIHYLFFCVFFFFFKQKTAYEMLRSLVGSEMCIRDSSGPQARLAEARLCHSANHQRLHQRDCPPRRARCRGSLQHSRNPLPSSECGGGGAGLGGGA